MFKADRIPYSQFFDIDEIADKSINLPHMMPDEETFISHMKKMDVRVGDHIICYDRAGIFSAPRVWYTFRLFGFKNVSVINGGYPKWLKENLPVEKNEDFGVNKISRKKASASEFDFKLDKSKLINAEEILTLSKLKKKMMEGGQDKKSIQIIDCRSEPRYSGKVEEPRPTIRKGHVDQSENVFFKDLLDENSCFKSLDGLRKEFEKKNIDINKPMTLYCGSGTTACVDIFALSLLGKFDNCKLYDGSWSEMVI
jgi:thiosulfate/3-mercaptopyruvate sulfurtransferase